MKESFYFLLQCICNHTVGAVLPTSAFACKRMLQHIDFSRRITILELGPGTGSITKQMLTRMNAESKLIAIEHNASFCRHLHEHISDNRLKVIKGDAQNIQSLVDEQIDYVVSGIPFSFFSSSERHDILRDVYGALKANGVFIAYQYTFQLRSTLTEYFEYICKERTWLNVPPCCIMVAHNT